MRILMFLVFCSAFYACDSAFQKVEDTSQLDSLQNLQRIDSIRVAIFADKKENALKRVLERKLKKGFNGAILVSQGSITLLDTALGFANFEDKLKLTTESPFQLASLSKTFTAISVMKLVEAGKLSLSLTVKDYYPDFPYEGVTLRSLLSHRSGLPYYEYVFDQKARREKAKPSNQDLIKWFAEASPIPKKYNLPDHYFSYNNTNFAILAAIVEKASGLVYGEYLRKEIFQPLGMNNSFQVSEGIDNFKTFGYQRGHRIPFDIYDNIAGDKGVYSTTGDLLKWYNALRSEQIVSKESLREVYTPRSFEFPGLRNYGYGFRLWLNAKQQTDYVYHTGWWKGYNTIMFFDLREDFVIILLSNRYNKDVYHIKEIIEILHNGRKETTVEENILDE